MFVWAVKVFFGSISEDKERRILTTTIVAALRLELKCNLQHEALVESQLEAEEWWGTEDEWEASFGDDSVYSGAAAAASDVVRISAPEAADYSKGRPAEASPLLIEPGSCSTFPLEKWRPRALAERFAGLKLRLNGCTDEGDAVTVPCGVFLEYLLEQDSYCSRRLKQRYHQSCFKTVDLFPTPRKVISKIYFDIFPLFSETLLVGRLGLF